MIARLANSAWFLSNLPAFASFRRAMIDPDSAQREILGRYLERNSETAFGIQHRLGNVSTYEQFVQRVPLFDYEDLQPWIDRIRNGEQNLLTRNRVTRLVPTSGSTAARKLIPYTGELQREFNRAIGPWVVDLFRTYPPVMNGCAYWSVTPAAEEPETEPSAVPIGFDDDSAYLGGVRKRMIDAVMAVPGRVRQLKSLDAFRKTTLLHLLARRDLRLMSVWHPSYLSLLLDYLAKQWDALLDELATSHPPRARELRSLNPAEAHRIWPKLKLISCWADGHAELAAAELAGRFPGVIVQPKGLLATEAFVTIPYAGLKPLAVRSHFFEFLDDSDRAHLAGSLQLGGEYNVVVTTAGGLWRYRLNDRVRVDGFVGKTPSLRFVGKVGNVSDRFGEKLSESFVSGVFSGLFAARGIQPAFAMLAPSEIQGKWRYALFIECTGDGPGLGDAVDAALRANPHYAWCRDLGQLGPPVVWNIRSRAYETFVAKMMSGGRRLGDIKPTPLSRLTGWEEVFAPLVKN